MENLDTKSLLLDMTTNLSRVGTFTLAQNSAKTQLFANLVKEASEIVKQRAIPANVLSLVKKAEQTSINATIPGVHERHLAEDAFTYAKIISLRAQSL